MPHVEVRGGPPLRELQARFQPATVSWDGAVLKTLASYLSSDERTLLLDCLTVEGHLRQSFFAILTHRETGIMVRLLPRTSPEKTPGVKRLVAWVARTVRTGHAGAEFGATNLSDLLESEGPPGVR